MDTKPGGDGQEQLWVKFSVDILSLLELYPVSVPLASVVIFWSIIFYILMNQGVTPIQQKGALGSDPRIR